MYYRDGGSNMGANYMMHGQMCPMMQQGNCPMMHHHDGHDMQHHNHMEMHQYSNPMMYGSNVNAPMANENMMEMKTKDDHEDERQLEMMFPESYFIISVHVKHHCDKLEEKHGKKHCPRKEEFDEIVEDICHKVEKEFEDSDGKKCEHRDDERIRRFGRGRLLRDFVGVLLLNELLGRRRPHYGYGFGYGPGYYY